MPGIPTIFLDRDGVVNRAVIRDGKPYPPASVDELVIIPEAVHSLRVLVDAGYLLIGVTNQPDVARGSQKREVVEEINTCILRVLPIREIFVCYHDDIDGCICRKPKPGLIIQGAEKYSSEMATSWMIGDRWKDVAAGKAAGLRTVFVNYNYGEAYKGLPADFSIDSIAALAETVLNHKRNA